MKGFCNSFKMTRATVTTSSVSPGGVFAGTIFVHKIGEIVANLPWNPIPRQGIGQLDVFSVILQSMEGQYSRGPPTHRLAIRKCMSTLPRLDVACVGTAWCSLTGIT